MGVRTTTGSVKLAVLVTGCPLVVCVTSMAQAQRLDITASGGWRSGGWREDLESGADVALDDALIYGLILAVP